MKPKKVICPICGEKMIPYSWGMEKLELYGLVTVNQVRYRCSCGCTIEYEGKLNCWQE